MKGVRVTVGLGLVLALVLLPLVSAAQSIFGTAPAGPALVAVGKPTDQQTPRPDLIVEDIRVGARNQLAVIIKNQGPADLPAGWKASASVTVDGVLAAVVPLAKPLATLGGGLGEAGGSSVYLLPVPLNRPVLVRVVADSEFNITESDEQNNTLERQVTPGPDQERPRIVQGPVVLNITRVSAEVQWASDEPADSVVRYGTSPRALGDSAHDGELATEHTVELTGLRPGTTYALRAESTDASGNTGSSEILSFTTEAVGDTTRPRIGFGLPAEIRGLFPIIPDASDDKGVDRVVFSLDGKPVFTDYSPPFEWPFDGGGTPEGDHAFTATAIDGAGNEAAETRHAGVRHALAAELSPVDVTIESPVTGTEVLGVVEVLATVVQEDGNRISKAEVWIDGVMVEEIRYPLIPRSVFWDRDPTAGSEVEVYYLWDTRLLETGSRPVVEVRAQDEFGNAGQHGVAVTKAAEPVLRFRLTRTVTRNGNWFHVELLVRNLGSGAEDEAHEVLISEACRGFAAAAMPRLPRFDTTRSEVTVEHYLASLAAGAETTFAYDLVPAMFDPELDDYAVGVRTRIAYTSPVGEEYAVELAEPTGLGDHASPPAPFIPSQVGEAFDASDYLLVTDPIRLFHYDADDDAVNNLLQGMATLALHKNGVLGLRRPGEEWASGQHIRDLLGTGCWAARMSPDWAIGGYLLLVGETRIIPSFTLRGFHAPFSHGEEDVVRITDYPYADVRGDEHPELIVGRIIGLDADEMLESINASLGVHLGRFAFDRSDALLVSGPEGTWEQHIQHCNDLAAVLSAQGFETDFMHSEYYCTLEDLLREALLIRGDFQCSDEPGHRLGDGVTPCPKTHPPTDQADLLALISKNDAEAVEAGRRGVDGDYDTGFAAACAAGTRRGAETKAGCRNKDVIFWNGHGGPGGWAWVLDDFVGMCGAGSDLWAERPANPLSLGSGVPVVLNASCLVANYEAEGGQSIARAFTRNRAGAYVGSTEVSPSGQDAEFMVILCRDYWNRAGISIGEALYGLRDDYIRDGEPHVWWRYMIYETNLYGDPTFGGR